MLFQLVYGGVSGEFQFGRIPIKTNVNKGSSVFCLAVMLKNANANCYKNILLISKNDSSYF